MANKLDDDELVRLYDAVTGHADRRAATRQVGQKAATLKGEKRSGLMVHARTGLPCPVCGDTVREVSFADTSPAVLPDLPDRRQAAGRPPDVQAAAVNRLVTFDLFSALIDSRTGASAGARRDRRPARLADRRRAALRRVGPAQQGLAARRAASGSRSPSTARRALAATYADLEPDRTRCASTPSTLLGSVVDWPLWPDVAASLPAPRRPAPRRRAVQRGRRRLRPHPGRPAGGRPTTSSPPSGCAPTSRARRSTGGRGSGPAATSCTWRRRPATSAGRWRRGST